jgi:hypothetical protein
MTKLSYAQLLARKIRRAKTYPDKCAAVHAWVKATKEMLNG